MVVLLLVLPVKARDVVTLFDAALAVTERSAVRAIRERSIALDWAEFRLLHGIQYGRWEWLAIAHCSDPTGWSRGTC